MNCQEVKENLISYLYDELPESARGEFERALADCPDCAAELDELRGVHELVATVPRLDVPAQIHNNILREARLAAGEMNTRRDRGFSFASFFSSPAFATALVVCLAVTVGLVLNRQAEPEYAEQGPATLAQNESLDTVATITEDELEEARSPAPSPPGLILPDGSQEPTEEEGGLDGALVAEGPESRPPVETNAAFAPRPDQGEIGDNLARGNEFDLNLDLQDNTVSELAGGEGASQQIAIEPTRSRGAELREESDEETERQDAQREQRDRPASREVPRDRTRSRERTERVARTEGRTSGDPYGSVRTPQSGSLGLGGIEGDGDGEEPAPDVAAFEAAVAADPEPAVRAQAVPTTDDDGRNQRTTDDDRSSAADSSSPATAQAEPGDTRTEVWAPETEAAPTEDVVASADESESDEGYRDGWDIPSQEGFAYDSADTDTPEPDPAPAVALLDESGSGQAAYGEAPQQQTDIDPLVSLYDQGLSRYNDGSYRDAVTHFDDFIGSAPSTSSFFGLALYYQGAAHLRLGNYREAADALERLVNANPGFERLEEARYLLAQAHELNGDLEAAEALYRQIGADENAEALQDAERVRARRRSRQMNYDAAEEYYQADEPSPANSAEKSTF